MKKTLIKLTVSTILFVLIAMQIDFNSVLAQLTKLNPKYLPILFILLIANYLVSSLRWQQLLVFPNSERVSFVFLAKLYFIGAFFNNFMPTSIGGDVYKVYRLGKVIGSNTYAFTATFMERFTGIVALVLVSYYGLLKTLSFWLSLLPTNLSENIVFVVLFKVLIFGGFWLACGFAFYMLKILSKKSVKIGNVYESLQFYLAHKNVLGFAFLSSFIVQFLAIATQYVVFLALGIELPLAYSLFIFPVVTIASFFIPSINGVGVQDTLYISLLGRVSVVPEVALSASLVYHILRLLTSLLGGLFYAFEKNDK